MTDTGATGHAWPCTRFYVTASDRDRCTCPVSDTGAVERVRDAIIGAGMTGGGHVFSQPLAAHLARAALAAAAPTTEDREALVRRMQDEVEYRVRTAAALAKGGHSVQPEVDAGRARIAALAAQVAALWGAR